MKVPDDEMKSGENIGPPGSCGRETRPPIRHGGRSVLAAWILPLIFSFGLISPASAAGSAGLTVDNTASIQFSNIIAGDTITFTDTSNTVSVTIELLSKVDVFQSLDTQFVRADSTYVFIKYIRNSANGTDTFTLSADSTIGAVLGIFLDANADSALDTAVDPPVSTIVLAEGAETTVLILVKLPAGVQDARIETISLGAQSQIDTEPSLDTAQVVITVDVAPPSEVGLLTPADGVTLRTLTPSFDWTAAVDTGVGLSIYNIELSAASDTDFGAPIRSADLPETGWAATPALTSGTYRWHVRSADLLGNLSVGIDSRVFTIDTSFTITQVSPADGADTDDTTPAFVWSGDGETFHIEIGLDTAFAAIADSATVLTKTYTPAGLADSTYYWRVSGADSAGLFGTSPIRTLAVQSVVVADTSPGELRLNAAGVQPSILTAQQQETVAVAVFALSADEKETVSISRLRLTHLGGAAPSGVSSVSVYQDAGDPAVLDAADTFFATAVLSGGVADLGGDSVHILAGDTAKFLVVYRMSSSLTEGDTFQVQIASAQDVYAVGVVSNDTPAKSGLPVSSRIFTVRSRYPSVVSVAPNDSALFLPPQDEAGILPIRIRFNIPIDTAALTTSIIQLLDENDTNRADTIVAVDSRTVEIRAVYADTAWPYGGAFRIKVTTGVRDLDVPADSLQAEFVSTFQTLANAQGELTAVTADGKAHLIIDTGDIDPSVKGIIAEVTVPGTSDTVLAAAMNSARAHPFLEPLAIEQAVYDYKIKKRDPNDTNALVKLTAADFVRPVKVAITVRKLTDYLEAKGVPLNFRLLRLAHYKEDAGQWEIIEGATLEEHSETVTVKGPATDFSLYGVFYAFAASNVKETFRSFPNPADPFTVYTNNAGQSWQGFQFAWNMPKSGVVTIKIYDFAGQLVRVFGPTTYAAGNLFGDNATLNARTWDGRNGRGEVVRNGAYFVFVEIRYNDGTVENATDRIAVVK
ncbi:Ig-like domain-containing protein [bacterium]|nr:Ig-like domain-containing protein [bacterium]